MNVERQRTLVNESPNYNPNLLYFLNSSNGISCPLKDHCQPNRRNDWCIDDYFERMNRVAEKKKFKVTDYNFVKRCKSCRLLETIESLATEWFQANGIQDVPISTELMKMADNAHPIEVHLLPLKAHYGATWFLNNRWVIQINSKQPVDVQRYTLFHETFHIVSYLQTKLAVGKTGIFNEKLANHFAATVMMPNGLVRQKWDKIKNLEQMASFFLVPKQAMCVRLKQLGII